MYNYLIICLIGLLVLGFSISLPTIKKKLEERLVWKTINKLYELYNYAFIQHLNTLYEENMPKHLTIHNMIVMEGGICSVLICLGISYSIKTKVLLILGQHITLDDINYRKISDAAKTEMLILINNGFGNKIYWFPPGNIIIRKEFLYRVLVANNKLK